MRLNWERKQKARLHHHAPRGGRKCARLHSGSSPLAPVSHAPVVEKKNRHTALVVGADCTCCTDIDDRTTAEPYVITEGQE